ncbi:hypothetical protein CWI38_1664p0010, partial [Hamiltosporidium tvaerminnensis]
MDYKNDQIDIIKSNHEVSSINFINVYVVKIHKSNETEEFRLLKSVLNLKFNSYMILANIHNFPISLKDDNRMILVEDKFFILLSNFIQFSFYFPIKNLSFEEFFVLIEFLDALDANFDNNFLNIIRNILTSLSTSVDNKLDEKAKSFVAETSKHISYKFYCMIINEILDIYFPYQVLYDIFIDKDSYFEEFKKYEINFEKNKSEILTITIDLLDFNFINIFYLEKPKRIDLQKIFESLKKTMESALKKKSIGFKTSIYRNDLEPTECEITEICEHSWLFGFLISEENLHNVMHFRCKNLYWSISGRICNFKKLDKLKIKLITLDINELIFFDKFSHQFAILKLIYSKIYSNVLNDILSLESLEYLAFSDTKIVMNNNASFSTFNYSIKYFEYHGSLFHNFYMIFEFIRMLVNIKTVVLNLTEDFVPLQYEEKFIPIKKIENLIYKNFNAQINHSSAINQFIATNKLSLC